jgi:hypothetical protein
LERSSDTETSYLSSQANECRYCEEHIHGPDVIAIGKEDGDESRSDRHVVVDVSYCNRMDQFQEPGRYVSLDAQQIREVLTM